MKKIFFFLIPLVLLAREELIIKVEGMHCPLCTTAVKKALKKVEGVESLKVLLETKSATIVAKDGIEDKVYLDAVKTTGYDGVIFSRHHLKD
ncbi:MAG: heavy metal-associated domain-containing protein [Sulfurospirillaceae bacterium]|nr:heavy metal-associated domain-containing protein [Sulfurospirillaceae bacterium]MDD2826802.1 heavy metal-associated domain-containing protein [Sulfurospirillaceae bacterium]